MMEASAPTITDIFIFRSKPLRSINLPAKKKQRYFRQRRRDRHFVAIPFHVQKALATLADNTVIGAQLLGATFNEDIDIKSIDATWSLDTQTVGEGPIEVGYNHDDLSVTEILEALDVKLLGPGSLIEKERVSRPVRRVGSFAGQVANEVLFNGRTERRTIKFLVNSGHAMALYAVNRSGGQLTGGAILSVTGMIYGVWKI